MQKHFRGWLGSVPRNRRTEADGITAHHGPHICTLSCTKISLPVPRPPCVTCDLDPWSSSAVCSSLCLESHAGPAVRCCTASQVGVMVATPYSMLSLCSIRQTSTCIQIGGRRHGFATFCMPIRTKGTRPIPHGREVADWFRLPHRGLPYHAVNATHDDAGFRSPRLPKEPIWKIQRRWSGSWFSCFGHTSMCSSDLDAGRSKTRQ